MEHNKQLYEHLFQAIRKQLESGLARTEGNDAFASFPQEKGGGCAVLY